MGANLLQACHFGARAAREDGGGRRGNDYIITPVEAVAIDKKVWSEQTFMSRVSPIVIVRYCHFKVISVVGIARSDRVQPRETAGPSRLASCSYSRVEQTIRQRCLRRQIAIGSAAYQ